MAPPTSEYIPSARDEFAYDMDAFRDERPKTIMGLIKRDPAIFAGVGLTVACLIGGLGAMYKGNGQISQYMMRGRVFFQGVTIACLVYSGYGLLDKYKIAVANETKKREALNDVPT